MTAGAVIGFKGCAMSKFIDFVLRWLPFISFLTFVFMVGAAVGIYETAQYISDEMDARFDCVAKP